MTQATALSASGIVYRIGEGAGPSAARGTGFGVTLRHRSAAQGIGIGPVAALIVDVIVTSKRWPYRVHD
jgi:hypothetical protein